MRASEGFIKFSCFHHQVFIVIFSFYTILEVMELQRARGTGKKISFQAQQLKSSRKKDFKVGGGVHLLTFFCLHVNAFEGSHLYTNHGTDVLFTWTEAGTLRGRR